MNATAPMTLLKSLRNLLFAIAASFILASPALAAPAEVSAAPLAAEQTAELASAIQIPDLQQAILSAEAASLAIFNGLEMTQEFVGKTERRKAAIEHGRNHASDRLKALVERARSAESYSDLSPTDRLVLKRLLGQ